MNTKLRLREKEKRKRGRPAKNRIEPIEAPPEQIAQALVRTAERKAEQRRSEQSR